MATTMGTCTLETKTRLAPHHSGHSEHQSAAKQSSPASITARHFTKRTRMLPYRPVPYRPVPYRPVPQCSCFGLYRCTCLSVFLSVKICVALASVHKLKKIFYAHVLAPRYNYSASHSTRTCNRRDVKQETHKNKNRLAQEVSIIMELPLR